MFLTTLGKLYLSETNLSRPKPLLLLTYLALEGVKERRYLAELFYQDTADPMLSLRVALRHLKDACGETILFEAKKVKVTLGNDVLDFLKASESHDFSRVDALYTGAFLEGFYLKDVNFELEEWILGTREYLAGLARQAQLQLGEALAIKGDFSAAASLAERAYLLAEASPPEPHQLELMLNLLDLGKSPRAPSLRKEMEDLGLPLQLSGNTQTLTREPILAKIPKVANNLFPRPTSFVGRQQELSELSQLLLQGQDRLLSITGPGGIGKTRLGLELAQNQLESSRWDGVYFIALDAIADPASIPLQFASALSFNFQGSTEPLEQLFDYLARKHFLLILDNFEQLIDHAQMLADLLSACPYLYLVVTSRECLNVAGERVYPLQGLALPENPGETISVAQANLAASVQLFLARAKSANLRFQFSAEVLEDIEQVCQLVAGAPLAIELCAAWVHVMPVKAIAQELGKNLDTFVDSKKNTPQRHRSLRAAFEHSWNLLKDSEKTSLMRLSVFRGGFRREAAAEVAEASIPVLAALLDKSLIQVLASGRFDRHALLYQFSYEKLAEQPALREYYQNQHAQYFVKLAEAAQKQLRSENQAEWLGYLEEESVNFQLALEWSLETRQIDVAFRLVNALGLYWYIKALFKEGLDWFSKVFQEQAAGELYASALYQAARLARSYGDFGKAHNMLEQSYRLFQSLEAKADSIKCLNELGILAATQSDYEKASGLFEQAYALAHELGDVESLELAISNLGLVYAILDEFEKAKTLLEQAMQLSKKRGDKHAIAHILTNLGLIALRQGAYPKALDLYQQGFDIAQSLNVKDVVAEAFLGMAKVYRLSQDATKARVYLKKSLELYLELSKPPGMIDGLAETASLALGQGAHLLALRLWGALSRFRKSFDFPMRPFDQRSHEEDLKEVKSRVKEREFAKALTEGELWSVEEAVAEAAKWLEQA